MFARLCFCAIVKLKQFVLENRDIMISNGFYKALITHDYDLELVKKMNEIGYMNLINSSTRLSKSFIVQFIDNIDWNHLSRQLPEPIVDRYRLRIVKWNEQLYGYPRTFEFIVRYVNKFDWESISKNPPIWFNEVHFEYFGDRMNWKHLTTQISKFPIRLISYRAADLEWSWISEHYIISEGFAKRFIDFIEWNHPRLDIRMLSTEFLYDIYTIRKISYELDKDMPIMHISKYKKIYVNIGTHWIKGFDPEQKIQIGCSISLEFAIEHRDDIEWSELITKNLLTNEMMEELSKH